MGATKQTIHRERLARPTPLVRERIEPWTHLAPSAKEQFAAARETAHIVHIQTDDNGKSKLHLAQP